MPIQTTLQLIGRLIYFLVWLQTLLYLLSYALFDKQVKNSQWFTLLFLGVLLGFFSGFMFAGYLSAAVGIPSGYLVGSMTFSIRRRMHIFAPSA